MADQFYVDPSGANGTGTIGSPFNSQANALAAVVSAETEIYLKRGFVYAPTNRFNAININKRPAGRLYIGAYGTASMPPTLNSGTFESPGSSSGWTYVGGSVWKKAYGASGTNVSVWRVFVGARIYGGALNNSQGTSYSFGTPIARTPVAYNDNEAAVLALIGSMGTTARRLWAHINQPSGFLYILTPGNTTLPPPDYYGGLYIVGSDTSTFGCDVGLLVGDAINTTVEDIDSIGALSAGVSARTFGSSGDSSNITLRRVRSYAEALAGIVVRGQGTTFMRGTLVEDSVSDSVATMDEDWNFRSGTGISWLNGVQDNIRASHNVVGCTFRRCFGKDGYHSTLNVDTTGGTLATAENVLFEDCVATSYNRAYGHLISTVGAGNGCVFDRIYGAGATQWIQTLGKITVRNSMFVDSLPVYPVYNGQGSVNSEPAVSFGTSAFAPSMAAGDATVEGCTFLDPLGFPVFIFSNSLNSIAGGAITFRNNIVRDVKYLNAGTRAQSLSVGAAGKGWYFSLNASEAAPSVNALNNTWYTGTTGTSLVIVQAGGSTTFSTLAAMTGASGNSEADPLLDSNGVPQASSPTIGGGVSVGFSRDLNKQVRVNLPTRGAYEYPTTRGARA